MIGSTPCQHTRTITIHSKSPDGCLTIWPNGVEENYIPFIPGIGGGEYIEIKFCVDCGQILNFQTGQGDQILAEQPEPDLSESEEIDGISCALYVEGKNKPYKHM